VEVGPLQVAGRGFGLGADIEQVRPGIEHVEPDIQQVEAGIEQLGPDVEQLEVEIASRRARRFQEDVDSDQVGADIERLGPDAVHLPAGMQ